MDNPGEPTPARDGWTMPRDVTNQAAVNRAVVNQAVVTRADAFTAGLSPAAVRHRIAAGRWETLRIRRGVYLDPAGLLGDGDPWTRHAVDTAAAIAGLGVPAVAGHLSAAVLHGLPAVRPLDGVTLLSDKTDGCPRGYRGLRLRAAELPPGHVGVVSDVPVTTIARTVVDLARALPFVDGVVLADAALRRGTTRGELAQVAAECTRWPGVRRARQVIDFADPRAETPLESRARVMFHLHELPAPDLQVPIGDEQGLIGVADFLWRAQRTVGEADGLLKYADPAILRGEKIRQERLERAGFQVVRMLWDDVTRVQERTVGRIRAAFGRAWR